MITLWIFLYFTILGIGIMSLFTEFRFSRKRTLCWLGFFTAAILLLDIFLYPRIDLVLFRRLYPLINHLPITLLMAYLGKNHGWRLVFQLLSSVLFCCLILHTAALIYLWSGRLAWVLLPAYGVTTLLVIWFLLRYLRPLYLQTVRRLRNGWPVICLILLIYYSLIFYVIPGYVGESTISTLLKPALSFLMAGVYAVIISLFSSVQRETAALHEAGLFSLQVAALQDHMDLLRSAEDALRIERHDLRHRLRTAAELVAQGKHQEALAFIDDAQRRLDEQKTLHWCEPPVLNAVFSSYFDQAARQGILVDAQIDLSGELPVPEAELAIILANALENAVHACGELPQDERKLRCKIIRRPSLMFEIANPCARTLHFDSQGLPVSRQKGHGVGVQSIVTFCKKYGAACQYEQQDGWLFLRVIL